ncbi:MAG: asparagine--tRNA ligase [Christensenellaceae bacterium]|jgi:asparaginyl-tRNA synthetase|nr:asparagine--tRNA ligase [Christensenellaceae bacterium]
MFQTIKEICGSAASGAKSVSTRGWVRNHRPQKNIAFIDLFDGSAFESIQVVYDPTNAKFSGCEKILAGACIEVSGALAKTQNGFEIQADKIAVLGDCPADYPIQPKRHTLEFLREVAYLRPRTRLFQAIFRVRSVSAMAIHEYFQERGYIYLHAPILTATDAEGAGNTFTATALDLEKVAKSGKLEFEKDFFAKPVSLTVSGQLEGEAFALAFGKIYTFGPTFRAENSNTTKHAAEFWMIEPEIAFADINEIMDVQEDFLRFIVSYVEKKCPSELAFLEKFTGVDLKSRINNCKTAKFTRIKFEDAINLLIEADKVKHFEFKPTQGEDIAKEHEKWLTEHFGGPVFLYDWPKDIKAFYMKLNPDGKTVAAVDLLVPDAGELMGGSQREEDYAKLVNRMRHFGIDEESLSWYANLRRFGSCVHGGFGMGFERFLIYITGVENIRDVIPFARTPKNCEF